ncbi:radical SAM additional 4Fe4S-binding SPASM domain-containing protein [Lachnospiraceae bacterium A4]|jgi:uncharacterized protein|nr:radical SAM additional 4Fe4S-binding SPASM domain-containing protein [Lachnospiraceae bacterium A4]
MNFSRYNIFVEKDKEIYLFNTKTLSIVELDSMTRDMFRSGEILAQNNLEEFIENGFIIESYENELEEVKNDYWSSVCREETLFMSIMTTLNCNLRCPYCFEHHTNSDMIEQVEEGIIKYIINKVDTTNIKVIKIDWYGGEPTLRMDVINRLSKKIIELCDKYQIMYISSITTNATMLSYENIRILTNAKITHMQITIDGPKSVHDKRRVKCNGEGTFEEIIDAIKRCYNKFKIVIRINVDALNYKYIDELLYFLSKSDLKNVSITMKGVVSSEERDVSKTQLNDKDLSDIIFQKNKLAAELGMKLAIFEIFDLKLDRFCIVDCINQFIIAPDGRLFKCGESFQNNDLGLYGYIDMNTMEFEIDNNKLNKWKKDPFMDSECVSCVLLPMCYGGCQMMRNVKKCRPCNMDLKYHLKDYIVLYLENYLKGEAL